MHGIKRKKRRVLSRLMAAYVVMLWLGGCAPTETGRVLNPKDFGAKGDVVWDDSCSVTAGSTSLICRAKPFKSGDVGKMIVVPKAGVGHTAPDAAIVTLLSDTESGQMTAGAHQYRRALVFANGTTAVGPATAPVINDPAHTSVKITKPTGCEGVRDCIIVAIYRNSVAAPTTFRFLTYQRRGDDYYDTVPDANIAASTLAPSSDTSFRNLVTTISTVNSSSTVTLADAAATTSANQSFVKWGTDDTAALRAMDAAVTSDSTVRFPPGRYWMGSSPVYTLDTQTGDHNGAGDVVVQVKETVDPAVVASGANLCLASNGEPQPECYTVDSVSGRRITIAGTLSRDYFENDYVLDDTVPLFDLKLGPATKNAVRWKGHDAILEWAPNKTGRIWGKNDSEGNEIEGFTFVGHSRVGQPPGQVVWATGDGSGTAHGYKIHDVRVEDAWQLAFYGIQNNDVQIYNFTCVRVLACTQSAGAGGAIYAKSRIRQHHFTIIGDPLGTDDAIAFFADAYDVEIANGVIDKQFTRPHWESAYTANCITVQSTGAGSAVRDVRIHNVECRNTGGILYGSGKRIDPRNINPNKSGFAFDTSQGGTLERFQVHDVTVDKAFYGLYLAGAADSFVDIKLWGLTVTNCAYTCVHLAGHKALDVHDVKITKPSQWSGSHGLLLSNLNGVSLHNVKEDGRGGVSGSTGMFIGIPMKGKMWDLRLLNNAVTGVWLAPNNDLTGPLTVENIWSEGNGSWGYEIQGTTATNGLKMKNLKGDNNGVALFRDGVMPP